MPDDPRFAPAKAPERYPTEAVGAPFELTLRVLRHTFPLVINLHGAGGLTDLDVERAARLAAAGFVAVAGCWQFSTAPLNPPQFYELKVTVIECPRLVTSEADAVAALIEVGRKQPGVRTAAVGLYGLSAGGKAALDAIAARRDIRAAVLDSPAVQVAPRRRRSTPRSWSWLVQLMWASRIRRIT